jgi:8-oxo-dGTP pyrophosphatase MutT (NUDIX family)
MEEKFAPREVFEQILEWAVIPTFDLVIEQEDTGIILVKRKLAPYKNQRALPGLRMLKGEKIDDTLKRVAHQELNIIIDTTKKQFLGQYVGMFTTEHNRQDISTGYHIQIPATQKIKINNNHFSKVQSIQSRKEIPTNMGAMYKFYVNKIFDVIEKSKKER